MIFVILFFFALFSCSASGSVCTPGTTISCVCADGRGAQSCNAMGSGYEPCVCSRAEAGVQMPDATPSCVNDCQQNTAQCVGNAVQRCQRSSDGCYHWTEPSACAAATMCQNGGCVAPSCSPRCDGSRCGPQSDGCGGMCPCPSGMACSNAGSCCVPQTGTEACRTMVAAWCSRLSMCCVAMGSSACMPWAYDATMCANRITSAGLDCGNSMWTTLRVCSTFSEQCTRDIRLVACTDIVNGSANFPTSCQ